KWSIQIFRLLVGAHSLSRTPWSEIIKFQMQMDEKRLKNRLDKNWQLQFQTQLDNIKTRVETAQKQFEQLREEYKTAASNYAQSSMERVAELKLQIQLAKIEFRAALDQWQAYQTFLLKTVPVSA
ncbi:MAG: hypothetical protein AB7P49_15750, partial [Bdellovibrionales bacterium]